MIFSPRALPLALSGLFLVVLLMAGCSSSQPATVPRETAAVEPIPSTEEPPAAPARIEPIHIPPPREQADDTSFKAGPFDNGKMWTFDEPPVAYFRETYGFTPDEAWFTQARLGALRLPNCTASFVSPHGLIMTNHHCARGAATAVSRPDETLIEDGFYAASLQEERRVPDLYVDQLIAIEDVTEEVYAALEAAETDAERAQARQDVIEAIQQRIAAAAGGDDVHVEVISLYHGGRYSAYTFRRYDDLRLVFVPELQIGYYGGDPDNFTYPRFTLDVSFLRAYDNGRPLSVSTYFPWTEEGVEEGDVVFVIGNPGGTYRLETVAQLEYRRDVREPAVLHFYESRAEALRAAREADPQAPGMADLQNLIFSLDNATKLYEGRVNALNDAMIMARRRDAERLFREAIAADAQIQADFGDAIDRMAQVQAQKTDIGSDFGAFLSITNPQLASETLVRGILAHRYLTDQQSEATGTGQDRLREQLLSVPEQPPGVDERLLAERLKDFERYLGADSPVVQGILQGRSPEEAARQIVTRSILSDSARTAEAVQSGTLSGDDPAVQAAAAFAERLSAYQSASAGLGEQEQELARALGRARFAVYGTDVPPDATFSLRIADGVVSSYPYNGTIAPPYTTFYGLYDHYYSYGPGTPWDLPERWLPPPADLDLNTPLNFVSTADITGGNSGSPVINRELEVVGLIFDGNIESLTGDYIYLPEINRAVAVDARGILEALADVYGADRLALELAGEAFVPTEQEADR